MYRKVDSRILLVDKDNSGVSDTRNLGLRLAEGEYVQFVDSDDYLDPGYNRQPGPGGGGKPGRPGHRPVPYGHPPGRRPRAAACGKSCPPCCPASCSPPALCPRRSPPEVRTYNFLAPGVYDTDSFALHLMDKPASYYYSVLWNKLYRRDILTSREIFFVSTIHWAEDLVFNLQYIQYASRFVSIGTPGYYYVQNPQSLVHTQISPAAIVKMKTTVFPYYKALYEKLGLYEQNKAAIRRYLVDISESSLPSGPLEDAVTGAMEKWDDLTAGMASAADQSLTSRLEKPPARPLRREGGFLLGMALSGRVGQAPMAAHLRASQSRSSPVRRGASCSNTRRW